MTTTQFDLSNLQLKVQTIRTECGVREDIDKDFGDESDSEPGASAPDFSLLFGGYDSHDDWDPWLKVSLLSAGLKKAKECCRFTTSKLLPKTTERK